MGCDIHCYLEAETTDENGNKRWGAVSMSKMDRLIPSRLVKAEHWKNDLNMVRYVRKSFYRGRNYSLFAMLSNVRNDTLDFLCDGGNCSEVMPSDTSDKIFSMHRHWQSDAHSLTIFTIKELLIDHKDFWEQDTVGYEDKPCKYKDLAGDFWTNINAVAIHAKWRNLDKWRVVMWYDN